MPKLKIIFISILTLLAIWSVIFGINLFIPRQQSVQNSSSSSSDFNIQQQAQSIAGQVQSGIVEDSLKSTARLNLSSISNSDLNKFSAKTFSDGSQFLKVDKSYYYNDKFYNTLNNPILAPDEGQPYTINKDFAYFILTKDFKLVFLDYGVKYVDEYKISNQNFLVFISGDIFGGYVLNVTTLNTSVVRELEEVPEGRFTEASKKDENTIALKLDVGKGRNPEIKTADVDITKFVTKFFSNKSSSSSASTAITFQ